MSKRFRIYQFAIVEEELKGDKFIVSLADNPAHRAICGLTGRMRLKNIHIAAGDMVKIELSPYSLGMGRILWRCD